MRKLLPNDNIRTITEDAITVLKKLRPTGQLTFSTLTQSDYDSLMGLLVYLKDFLNPSHSFCKECRGYYGLTISMECIKCNLGLSSHFSILRKSDFENNYRDIKTQYKGTMFKELILDIPLPSDNIIRINEKKDEEITEGKNEPYPSLSTYLTIENPPWLHLHEHNLNRIKELKKEILENAEREKSQQRNQP